MTKGGNYERDIDVRKDPMRHLDWKKRYDIAMDELMRTREDNSRLRKKVQELYDQVSDLRRALDASRRRA